MRNLTNFGHDDSCNFIDNIMTKNHRVIKPIPPGSSWYQDGNKTTKDYRINICHIVAKMSLGIWGKGCMEAIYGLIGWKGVEGVALLKTLERGKWVLCIVQEYVMFQCG